MTKCPLTPIRRILADIIDDDDSPNNPESNTVIQLQRIEGPRVAERLCETRKRLGLSRKQLAESIGVSEYRIRLAETNPRKVPLAIINSICISLFFEIEISTGHMEKSAVNKFVSRSSSGILILSKRGVDFLAKNPNLIAEAIRQI